MNRRVTVLIALLAAFAIVAGSDTSAFAKRKKKRRVKPVVEWQWVCAKPFERRHDFQPASINIITYREKLLMIRKRPVRRAIFVFPTLYRVMRNHIRSVVEKRYTIEKFTEDKDVSFDAISMTRVSAAAATGKKRKAQAPNDKVFRTIKEIGLKISGLSRTRITTGEFNRVPSKSGRSTLLLEVLNGKEILDKDSTIVIVSRLDTSEEAGFLPFSTKLVEREYVTSSEFGLMERLGKLYGVPFTMSALAGGKPLYAYTKIWKKAKDWLTSYWAKPASDEEAKKKKEKFVAPKHPGRC